LFVTTSPIDAEKLSTRRSTSSSETFGTFGIRPTGTFIQFTRRLIPRFTTSGYRRTAATITIARNAKTAKRPNAS